MKKVVLITGGTGGIGEAIASRLARDNFDLHIAWHLNSSAYENLLRKLSQLNIVIGGTKADIRNPDDCKKIVDDCIKTHKSLWGLVLNAGIFIPGGVDDLSPDQWKNLVETNLSSSIYLLKYALPHLRKSRGSVIFIGTGSIADSPPAPEYPLYAASKAGIYVLMRSLAVSEGKNGVRVNTVSPGLIDTGNYSESTIKKFEKEIPLGKFGKPDDIASTVSFLLNDNASYISGTNIDISGGWIR